MFLLEGSFGAGHPSSVEFIRPLLSHVPTQSLQEPTDLGVHQKGTNYLKFKLTMMMMMICSGISIKSVKWQPVNTFNVNYLLNKRLRSSKVSFFTNFN